MWMEGETMQIIISPAKTMREAPAQFPGRTLPEFLAWTEPLCKRLQAMDEDELKALWKCSEALVQTNRQRLARMDLRQGLTAALFAYEGIQYRCLAPETLNERELAYLAEHLRILSGFYGLLRPFDGITPYRLEMQAKLPMGPAKDLYQYWGSALAEKLCGETGCILNLASKEYSRSVARWLPEQVRFITCVFGAYKNGKVVEKSTMSKMLRGEMVRYMAQNGVTEPEELQAFRGQGYRFDAGASDEGTYVFIKESK